MKGDYRLVVTTAGNIDEAERIARRLVEKRLAACVNIVPKIRSVYRWQGRVEVDREALLLVKTTAKRIEKIKKRIRKLHSYEVPEILVFEIADGDDAYLRWLDSAVK